jgi:prevent-host-death family protein
MTKARPRLTEIVDRARDRDAAIALTEYGRPRAIVVSVPFFERAAMTNDLAYLLQERHPQLLAELLQDLPTAPAVPSKMDEDF